MRLREFFRIFLMRLLVALALLACLSSPAFARARADTSNVPAPPARQWGSVVVEDSYLAERIESLLARSSHFRVGFDSLSRASFTTVVMQDTTFQRSFGRAPHPGRYEILPDFRRGQDGRAIAAFVAVDVSRLESLYAAFESSDKLAADVELILAHELYAHLAPMAHSGLVTDHCVDPLPIEVRLRPEIKGCSTERENLVRDDLGIARRPSYRDPAFTLGDHFSAIIGLYAVFYRGVATVPEPHIRTSVTLR